MAAPCASTIRWNGRNARARAAAPSAADERNRASAAPSGPSSGQEPIDVRVGHVNRVVLQARRTPLRAGFFVSAARDIFQPADRSPFAAIHRPGRRTVFMRAIVLKAATLGFA